MRFTVVCACIPHETATIAAAINISKLHRLVLRLDIEPVLRYNPLGNNAVKPQTSHPRPASRADFTLSLIFCTTSLALNAAPSMPRIHVAHVSPAK
jgi:hypothetical protein